MAVEGSEEDALDRPPDLLELCPPCVSLCLCCPLGHQLGGVFHLSGHDVAQNLHCSVSLRSAGAIGPDSLMGGVTAPALGPLRSLSHFIFIELETFFA